MFENILDPKAAKDFIEHQRLPPDAVPTPFVAWNEQCRGDGGRIGLALGWHVLLAGKVNLGKSALMLNLIDTAVKEAHGVCLTNLEMGLTSTKYRYYSVMTGMDSDDFERGSVDEESAKKLQGFLVDLQKRTQGGHRLYVNKEPQRDLDKILKEMRWKAEAGVRVFFLDYLQLVRGASSAQEERYRIAEVSSRLFEFAHEWDVLTVGLSQFARSTTREGKERPAIEGMYGSSSLEADADQVVLLDHTRYERDLVKPWIHRTYLILAKNRHGGKGDIPFEWSWKNFRCREALPDEEHLWPGAKKEAGK